MIQHLGYTKKTLIQKDCNISLLNLLIIELLLAGMLKYDYIFSCLKYEYIYSFSKMKITIFVQFMELYYF
jgi:hypothetical protein